MKKGWWLEMGKADPEMLFDMAAETASAIGSKYRDVCQCRDDLYDFMDANEWFGLKTDGSGHDLRVCGLQGCHDRIALWLKAYRRTDEEKLEILLSEYRCRYPCLCREYSAYVADAGCAKEARAWQVLDYLLSSARDDLDKWDDRESARLIKEARNYCTAAANRAVIDFLGWSAGHHGEEKYNYILPGRRLSERNDTAYDAESFFLMAYCVFNRESWEENSMLDKACTRRNYAELWLFIALHFICGLRSTDMRRLPAPALPFYGDEMRRRLLARELAHGQAISIAADWQLRLDFTSKTPNKTRKYSGVPDLNVFVPETLLFPIGLILAAAFSYHKETDPFVSTSGSMLEEKRFFGDTFIMAAGNRRFSTRRANKSYVQGIEAVADMDNGEGKVKGYMMAALARSHKGGFATLPKTTDIYLKDAVFSGYKPEFILREMFERGVFGFIPAILLEEYGGDDYRRLDVHAQTLLIKEIGLSPAQIDGIAAAAGKALAEAVPCVRSILETAGRDKEETGRILQRIAGGTAMAKQDEYLCLRNAAGLPCPNPDRSGCLGCGYEIYTKAALRLLMSEYVRLSREKRKHGGKPGRYGKILESAVLPAVWEIVGSIRHLYPDEDITDVLDMIERGISDAGSD